MKCIVPLTNHWLVHACLVEFNVMAIRLVKDTKIEIVLFSIDSQDHHHTTLVCWQISTPHLEHIGDICDFSLANLTTPSLGTYGTAYEMYVPNCRVSWQCAVCRLTSATLEPLRR